MQSGQINLRSYSRAIKKDIESEVGERVAVETITTALSRIAKKLTQTIDTPADYIGDASIQTGLSILNFHSVDYDSTLGAAIHFLETKSEFFVATRGIHHSGLFTKSKLISELPIELDSCTRILDNMVGITITLLDGHENVPGVCAYILNRLALSGISVEETVSAKDEMTVIVFKKDARQALSMFM